ncbi:hypothetical protein SEUCBS139899_002398 [Sporothrix eucalyptigena]|uniref:Ankyrin repeat containing protein n=1 Tax=Sporothrix eucalyptigena TaxID=1812306 RepID=A0ABP0B1L5_9PEZI
MSSPIGSPVGQQRLAAIANEWGISLLSATPSLTKPLMPFSLRTLNDDQAAEDLLKCRRLAANNDRQQLPKLRRVFSTTKRTKEWDADEISSALDDHVDQNGSAGIAEALAVRLLSAQTGLNAASAKKRLSIITRRRSVESFDRGRLLKRAIEHRNGEMVAVLVPYADPLTLDLSLTSAIQSRRLDIVEHLLRYGASINSTTESQVAFRQVCAQGGHADLVALLLASDARPGSFELSPAMIDASKRGCFATVLHLSRAAADGSFKNADALKTAITASRVDIVLAIVTGQQPPNRSHLNDAFKVLFNHPSVLPNEKMALAEILLCSGARGDRVARALVQSCLNNFSEMASLLVHYGASVEYDNAAVLRHTISRKRFDLIELLLSDHVVVSKQVASKCITFFPETLTNEQRRRLLTLLLHKGAGGSHLSDYLVDVTKANDTESAILLLTPYFPQGVDSSVDQRTARRRTAERHNVASVNHKDGMALQIAVKNSSFDIVDIMLATLPDRRILDSAFPHISSLRGENKYQMLEIFLKSGISDTVVAAALQKALEESPQVRDQRIIAALLRANADINFSGGAGLMSTVAIGDVALLQTILCSSQPNSKTLSAAMAEAVAVPDPHARRQIVYALLSAGADQVQAALSKALIATLGEIPADTELVEMLLTQGKADINYDAGTALVRAIYHPDTSMLDLLLRTRTASPDTLGRGLYSLANKPSNSDKKERLAMLLRYTKQQQPLDSLLMSEVQLVVKASPQECSVDIIMALLSAGADINSNNGNALGLAVATPIPEIVEIFLQYQPSDASLVAAIPRIFSISNARSRLTVAEMLLKAGVPTYEINRTLNHAVVNFPQDHPLLRLLAPAADPEDGSAVYSAVKSQNVKTVAVLLSAQQFSVSVLNSALKETMLLSDKTKRQNICLQLIHAGASNQATSDALLVAASDGDLHLGNILIENGANPDHNDGLAVVKACQSGAQAILEMLLKRQPAPKADTLLRGFQKACKLGNLATRGEIFRLLLEQGVSGDAVHEELVVSAGYGDSGLHLVRLLLEHGADIDYKKGLAVKTSTRNGSMSTLALLLGISYQDIRERTPVNSPSQDTLISSLKSTWRLDDGDKRYQIIQWLFAAGLQLTEAVHVALNKAVKEKHPNLGLVQLLLEHGASPLADGCQTLVNAACQFHTSVLELCVTLSKISQADLSYALQEALNPARVNAWLSQQGHDTAKLLLGQGAQSTHLGQDLVLCVKNCDGYNNGVARQFVELFVKYGADINVDNGASLQTAAKMGDVPLVQKLLTLAPEVDIAAMSFPHIFESGASENTVLQLIDIFHDYRVNDECGIDVMYKDPDSDPVLFVALSRYPRSVRILEALLGVGFYYDQMIRLRVTPDMEEIESVSLLFWALFQPQSMISNGVIELLIENGCKVNFQTSQSLTTPLMLAIQSKRTSLVKTLIRAGAEVDVVNCAGNTPLFMAVLAGGDAGITMMTDILGSGVELSKNDGALHLAAHQLNLKAVKLLVQSKYDIDYPCPLYNGFSALMQVCLHGSDDGPMNASKLKNFEQCASYLINQGSNLELRSNGKTPLLLAFESGDPVAMTRALLQAGMYKFVNDPFNQYHSKKHTYSPTMYVRLKLKQKAAVRESLLSVLEMSRAEDVYYARSGPQPSDAVNVPEDLMHIERERLAEIARVAAEEAKRERERRYNEELARQAELTRRREIQALQERNDAEIRAAQRRIMETAQAEVDAANLRAAGDVEAARTRAYGDAEAMLIKSNAEIASMQAIDTRRQTMRASELEHARQLGEQNLQIEDRRQRMLLQYDRQRDENSINTAQQRSAIAINERQTIDQYDQTQSEREMKRLNKVETLANAFVQQQGQLGGNRGVAGYIMGEVS